ncbi:hypothetical protein ACFV5G_22735 [Streptomyces sp. NPDC059766]|uniref:hypothetical protein n=1 Tax=Streptomyces sp. NPDC059766 TaxID=3346940 RepID=UPI003654ED58
MSVSLVFNAPCFVSRHSNIEPTSFDVDDYPVPAMPPFPSGVAVTAAMTVQPPVPREARGSGRAGLAGGAGGARRAGQALADAVRLEGDAPCLELVELLLVGDEHGFLRDERDGQGCAEYMAASRATPRLFHTSHNVPHVM